MSLFLPYVLEYNLSTAEVLGLSYDMASLCAGSGAGTFFRSFLIQYWLFQSELLFQQGRIQSTAAFVVVGEANLSPVTIS